MIQVQVTNLSPEQLDLVRRVVAGDSNKMAARALGISITEVGNRLTSVYKLVGVQTKVTLAVWAAPQLAALDAGEAAGQVGAAGTGSNHLGVVGQPAGPPAGIGHPNALAWALAALEQARLQAGCTVPLSVRLGSPSELWSLHTLLRRNLSPGHWDIKDTRRGRENEFTVLGVRFYCEGRNQHRIAQLLAEVDE